MIDGIVPRIALSSSPTTALVGVFGRVLFVCLERAQQHGQSRSAERA
jgi:hypothetical protein